MKISWVEAALGLIQEKFVENGLFFPRSAGREKKMRSNQTRKTNLDESQCLTAISPFLSTGPT
jgi:hypothetical protein